MTRPDTIRIRDVATADAGAIANLYGHHVRHGTGTFEEVPPDTEEMAERIAAIRARGWPWLVAEAEGATIVGYAYATQFRDRAAYRRSAEDSVYVHPDQAGRGVGAMLLDALMTAATEAGFARMFAVIGDSANLASIRLHERAGFTHAGKLDAAGIKFGRALDVVFMQRALERD